MCGICGKLYFDPDRPVEAELIKRMMASIHHRGPDDEGMYVCGPIGLGHKRLSIIDVSTGRQPISNEDRQIWVVYNGEVYNFQELRRELLSRGHIFKTETDTEVLVHLYEEYGEGFVSRLRGMFAFALWDQREKALLLARDRVGIKPLYYRLTDDSIIFASEIKAILQDSSVVPEVNYGIIDRFLTYLYTPGTETLFKNIYRLSPGFYLLFKNGKEHLKQYWDIDFAKPDTTRNLDELVQQLSELLRESARIHMISDVPVGFLLSGGVDSTALLSLAMEETNKDVSTFTIGFEGQEFADERHYARLAAREFGTKHYDITIDADDFKDFLPKYVWHMEEPVCEPSAIALHYVSKLAKEHVKVLISGEGGDEAFAGYTNYRDIVWLERFKTALGPFKGSLLKLLLALRMGHVPYFRKIYRYAPLLSMPLERYYYSRTSSPFRFFPSKREQLYSESLRCKTDTTYSIEPSNRILESTDTLDCLSKMLYVDTKTWLPDDLLMKADKITMAHSLELRVPLLDHKILEFAASLPSRWKVSGFNTKHILKKAVKGRIPAMIARRKKAGFPVPYESWLRSELDEFTREILLDKTTLERGYFEKGALEQLLSQHSAGRALSQEVFSLISLELWHRAFIDNNR